MHVCGVPVLSWQAIIYVVDSSDTERIGTSSEEFHAILDEEELKDALILVYANKQARAESYSWHCCMHEDCLAACTAVALQGKPWHQGRRASLAGTPRAVHLADTNMRMVRCCLQSRAEGKQQEMTLQESSEQ